ncbi:MAG: cytochrome-c peroxidase, partial [Bacteriovoracaceae bacterium]|nr:cytochrome-c peroxidase [Bacteriovoracaceae bacterium]
MGRIPTGSELELGRQLFSDTILSRNNDVSCATCHLSNHGFADGNTLNVGTMGKGGPNGDNVGHKFDTGKLSVDRSLG